MSWLSAAWHWYATESVSKLGVVDHPNAGLVNPVAAGIGAVLLIVAALQQAATARRRHKEQTDADRQRRITESFSKAIEQLGSDKLEVRLGGIYSLERISKESLDDYWTVMENLTAFVRERSRRTARGRRPPRPHERTARIEDQVHENHPPAPAARVPRGGRLGPGRACLRRACPRDHRPSRSKAKTRRISQAPASLLNACCG